MTVGYAPCPCRMGSTVFPTGAASCSAPMRLHASLVHDEGLPTRLRSVTGPSSLPRPGPYRTVPCLPPPPKVMSCCRPDLAPTNMQPSYRLPGTPVGALLERTRAFHEAQDPRQVLAAEPVSTGNISFSPDADWGARAEHCLQVATEPVSSRTGRAHIGSAESTADARQARPRPSMAPHLLEAKTVAPHTSDTEDRRTGAQSESSSDAMEHDFGWTGDEGDSAPAPPPSSSSLSPDPEHRVMEVSRPRKSHACAKLMIRVGLRCSKCFRQKPACICNALEQKSVL